MAVPIVEFGVEEILKCDHSYASAYWAVLSCGTVYYITQYMQGGSRILVFDESYWAVLSLVLFSH